jgi:hypothetical protein
MAALTTRRDKGAPLTFDELDDNFENINTEVGGIAGGLGTMSAQDAATVAITGGSVDDVKLTHATGWKDMLAPVGGATVPSNSAPSPANFGPAHTPQRREYAFGVGDYVFIQPFHVNHDIFPGAEAYFHVHWATNGTSTGLVQWEITFMRALGHNQANFSAPEVILIEQAAHGTAWRHMVSETVTPIILTEPDELIIATLRRVAPSSGSNADIVFGLMVDLHYQADRNVTPQKAPDFFAE